MIAEALTQLGLEAWVLRGNPTNEAEFIESFTVVINGEESKDQSLWGVTWAEVETVLAELKAAQPLKELRAERDRRIAETDWWASSDLTMTDEQVAYRQALRDITESYSSLEDVVWPVKP